MAAESHHEDSDLYTGDRDDPADPVVDGVGADPSLWFMHLRRTAIGDPDEARDDTPAPSFLFLSLFLVVLAFFIVLAAISQPRETWSRYVLDSLSRTFAPDQFRMSDLGDPDGGQDHASSEVILSRRMEALLAADLEILGIERSENGARMEVEVSSGALFTGDGTALSRPAAVLIGRIADAVQTSDPNFRIEVGFLLNTEAGVDGRLPADPAHRDLARAGGIADALMERGVDVDRVTIGLELGDPAVARFSFDFARTVQAVGDPDQRLRDDAP